MAIFTLAPSMIRVALKDNYYLQKVLFTFLLGYNKVAQDAGGHILQRYREAGNSEMIFYWTRMLADTNCFEYINVQLSGSDTEEKQFLSLSRATKGKHLAIVDSIQEITIPVNTSNTVTVDGEDVILKDKDEAVLLLNPQVTINMQNCIFANGDVTDSNNNNTYDNK